MISRRAKAMFYAVAGPAMSLNAWRWRRLRRWPSSTRAHLGPGQSNYVKGWVNVDANCLTAKIDIWANLAERLPFPSESLDAVYSHHVIEHLPNLPEHFAELFRCLRPGGVFRVGGPNGEAAIKKYLDRDVEWFSDFPERRLSIGGKLDNFIFCRGEHLTILTPPYLEELALAAGFDGISILRPRETGHPERFGSEIMSLEYEDTPNAPHTILIEGIRPFAQEAGLKSSAIA